MTRRYPLAPLADAVAMPLGSGFARRLGLSGTTWKQYRDHGITERVADNLATKLGLHPYEVWPEMADHALADIELVCADEKCDATFVPEDPRRRFCSDRCRWRADARRRRSTPEGAATNRERRRAYYAENGTYERRREQRAYWQDPEAKRARKRAERAARRRDDGTVAA